ncbi:hypothetical protein PMIN06_001505 [Paraphaeosphaeria minitans]
MASKRQLVIYLSLEIHGRIPSGVVWYRNGGHLFYLPSFHQARVLLLWGLQQVWLRLGTSKLNLKRNKNAN